MIKNKLNYFYYLFASVKINRTFVQNLKLEIMQTVTEAYRYIRATMNYTSVDAFRLAKQTIEFNRLNP